MPTATLTYTLPEEQSEFAAANTGVNWSMVAWHMDEYLRRRLKYETLSSEADATLEAVREHLHEYMDDEGVSLDMIQ